MVKHSSALPLARATLRSLMILNWLFGAAILALLTATIGLSLSAWLAVILTFVLARVFAEGALMRQDLEGTV